MAGQPHFRINDPHDPAISEFCSIREKDLTGRSRQFIAEGAVVLRLLATAHKANARFRAEKLLVLDTKVAGISDILSDFPNDIPVYIANSKVLDAIAGFHLHRGILALGSYAPDSKLEQTLLRLPDISLVLVGIGMSNHDNLGSMFRNAAAFGADHVFLDSTSCDPLYRKAIRVSVGSVLTVPWTRSGSSEHIVGQLLQEGFEIWGLSPSGKTEIRDLNLGSRVALVMGTEGSGLPETLISTIKTARIPQMPGIDSLNLGTATGIALFHAASAMRRL